MVISTAKFPPNRIAACGGGSRRHRTASCRLLAGRDLGRSARAHPPEFARAGLRPPEKLTLRELEALARALLSVLLAFLHSRIARQKSVLAQRRAQLWIEPRNGPRQSHAHRASLPAYAATMCRHHHVHLVRDIRKLQWLDRVMLPRVVRKILLHRPAVDRELARSRTQEHARHRLLAPPCSQKPSLCARDGRARRTQCSSSRLDDCPAAISIPVRAAANILSAACGSISNFTSAYSPLRHHLEGTATCGTKQIPLTAKQPGASAPRAAPNPRHPDRYATSSHAARATYSSAACREPLRESSSPTWTRAAFSPALPSTRRDIRCANNKLFARPCFRSCEPCRH